MTTSAVVTSLRYTAECSQCSKLYHGEIEGDILNDGDPKLHPLVDENLQLFGWKLYEVKDVLFPGIECFCSSECLEQYILEEELEDDL
jgi:hypothetical protein